MGGKTLIGGTAYSIRKGKTLIGGTGYTIAKGKTLIGGTAHTVVLSPLDFVRVGTPGDNWTSGSYTLVFTEDGTKFRSELTGSPTVSGYDSQFWIGHWFWVNPGDSVSITVSVNSGTSYCQAYVWYETDSSGTHYDMYSSGSALTNRVFSFTAPTGKFGLSVAHGSTNQSVRWCEVTKIVVNSVQIFPIV